MNKSLIYRGREAEVVVTTTPGGYSFDAQVDYRSLNIGDYAGASTEQEALDDGISFAKEHIDLLSPDDTA